MCVGFVTFKFHFHLFSNTPTSVEAATAEYFRSLAKLDSDALRTLLVGTDNPIAQLLVQALERQKPDAYVSLGCAALMLLTAIARAVGAQPTAASDSNASNKHSVVRYSVCVSFCVL